MKYYYQRGLHYLRKGLLDPSLAVNYLRYGSARATQLQVRRFAKALGVVVDEVDRHYQNAKLSDLMRHISEAATGTPFVGIGSFGLDAYVLLRILQPETVVETGVEAGVSSAFILKALADNNKGTLYSIDYRVQEGERVENIRFGLIPAEVIPRDKEVGFVIPDNLRDRWVYRPGKSSGILPGLLRELGQVDTFMHDSDHSYENIMFELTTAWHYLPERGLVLAHDTDSNSAFRDFARKVGRKAIELTFRGGATALIR